jgi:hypothetical protein
LSFLEKETVRSSLFEERTRQATQSKEQVSLAKSAVMKEIAFRLRGKVIVDQIRPFLLNVWKDVLVLAFLRRDKDQGSWNKYLRVMELLINASLIDGDISLAATASSQASVILDSVKQGLETVSFDPHRCLQVLHDLEAFLLSKSCSHAHHKIEKGLELTESSPESATVDPRLSVGIMEIRTNLPDVDEITLDDVSETAGLGSPAVIDLSDEFSNKAASLKVGDWIEIQESQDKTSRAKLSWKSQVSALYVFVNRKGIKVKELTVVDLAEKMRSGLIRTIEGSSTPLMDRAMSALMQSLKAAVKPAGEPA